MFHIISRNDLSGQYTVHRSYLSLEEAAAGRIVSGDLVVSDDHVPVVDYGWLWDWERQDSNSYAHRMLRISQEGKFVKGRQLTFIK